MATSRRRGDCPELLAFEEVRHRLGLGTRLPVGRMEVQIASIIGSVGRSGDFDGCFRPKNAHLRTAIRERATDPSIVDLPIRLLQVDHAYFVDDGHKRLSIAIRNGQSEIDADVDRFETTFHVAPGTTMGAIRATSRERRFRETTGLAAAVPDERFPLSDPDGYLELEESVKAHALDLSYSVGRLLSREEGARHWIETVFRPVLVIADASAASRLLASTTAADRFLLFRRGFDAAMDTDWRIPEAHVERGIANLAEQTPGRLASRVPRLGRRTARRAELLPSEADVERREADPASPETSASHEPDLA
jgi:hypothetical protein